MERVGVAGFLLGQIEVALNQVPASLLHQGTGLGAGTRRARGDRHATRGGRGERHGTRSGRGERGGSRDGCGERHGRRKRGAASAGQIQARAALAERFAVGGGQVLFVGRDALEQIDGVGLLLVLESELGEPQLFGGGAAAVERGDIVVHQAGEFLLFGRGEGSLAVEGLLKEDGGALVVAVALGLDGFAQGPGRLGAEERGYGGRVRRRPSRGQHGDGKADDEDEPGSCFCPSHHRLL